MTLSPPSSHQVTMVSGITVTGTPSTGQVLTATGATAADWQTPAAVPPTAVMEAQLLAGSLGAIGQYAAIPSSHSLAISVTGPPLIVAAMGTVCATVAVAPWDIPNLSDQLDYSATLYVTNLAGTQTLSVTKGSAINTPVVGRGAFLDWTGTSPTLVGADLSWTDTTSTVTSTAGGIFVVTLQASCSPD